MDQLVVNYTVKSVVFESVKIKKSSEVLEWSKKPFVRRFENDTFESVEIETVVLSAHPLVLLVVTLNSTLQTLVWIEAPGKKGFT